MIQIGNQTTCWTATPTEPFEYAIASGFDAFEWCPDKRPGGGWDEGDLDPSRRRRIRETAIRRGIRLSVHARSQANPLQPESYRRLLEALELAQSLGATLLNVHLCLDAGLAAFVEAIPPLIVRVAAAGLQLSVENTPDHSPEDFNELFARFRALDFLPAQQVGMCLDLGHANLSAGTRNDYLRFLDRLDPRVPIIHLHLHENWGDADTHLPLFTGPAGRDDSGIRGLLKRLQLRDFAGSMILEQWPHPPSLLDEARDRLLQLLCQRPREATSPSGAEPSLAPGPCAQADSETEFVIQLVAADKRCRSWREKLDFVRGLLTAGNAPLTTEQLVDIAIYLRFLGTGEIPCAEDGRHFRPAHHARIALQIRERLARLTTPDNACIVRKIYPWLPSSAREFQRAEPLTRIRDIAHRNDIPPELKREIKHSLQNKLHRCAGPEDLVTSSALLERITAPGADYSSFFVEQFSLFHEELKEFFNARSLDERLKALLPAVGATQAGSIRSFLSEKAGSSPAEQLAAFRTLTTLRRGFLEAVERDASPEAQEFLLADIGLEDFGFVLLSEMINSFEADKAGVSWEPSLDMLLLTIANLALSGVDTEECRALEAEVRAWREGFDPSDREQLLRLKATVDRCRRLAEDYSDRILASFPQRVDKLGVALGVAEHAIRVFCEADIRGHIIFQLSKLVASVLRRLREKLALPAWDVIVPGQAVGRVKPAELLDELGLDLPERMLVLLKNAEGDEEIPSGVAGIVLAHEIPHLSHLAVRARQAGVVLVACEGVSNLEKLRGLEEQMISLVATPEKVEWKSAAGTSLAQHRNWHPPARVPGARLNPERAWISLENVVAENGGGKAAGARRLAELACQDGAGFKTSPALVVPFGVMEAALRAAPEWETEYRRLLGRISGLSDFTEATGLLRDLVRRLRVPDELVSEVCRKFGRNTRLIVRSSANCEDLEELAGAGLYESVANVAPSEVAGAVREVWSSLWTRRAALSRKQSGIPHEQAHIAVLIQEMLTPNFSFVLHTVNPISHNPRELYAEIVVGFGETLASGATHGNPYRMVCDKESGAATMVAFANFSQALWPDPTDGLGRKTVDYSRIDMTCEAEARKRLGRRLTSIVDLVERAFQKPQDIEGVVMGDEIYLVQARAQQGLPGKEQR